MPKGGTREGAGRPVTENPRVAYSTRLRKDQADWLKKQPNASREIERALDAHIALKDGK